jgi:3-phenylpropionate/trans-cinnamate dioxygenase ferredoxin component
MSDLTFSQLVRNKPVRLEKNGKSICVARIGDEVFAIDDTCTHGQASLSEGDVTGFRIECWLHGAEFDLRTGEVMSLPATQAVKTYQVSVVADSVTIEI